MAQLLCSSPTFQQTLSCETGSFSCRGNPCSLLRALSLYFPVQPAPPRPPSPPPRMHPLCSAARLSPSCPPTGLDECFFNSVVVKRSRECDFLMLLVFIVFRLAVQGSKVFLPTPPSWQELQPLFLPLLV